LRLSIFELKLECSISIVQTSGDIVMAEELQNLLEKIQEEGVKKADSEKSKIISEAKAEAEKIIADAKKKSEDIVKKSEEDAKRNEERAANTIQQASRDIVIALNAELQDRLKNVVKECIGEAMTPEMMGKLILEMQKNYIEKTGVAEPSIEILLNEKDCDSMEKFIKASLLANLKSNPDISIGHDFTSGLKIGFKGNDLFFDFSDDALAEMICAYVGPRLAAIISK